MPDFPTDPTSPRRAPDLKLWALTLLVLFSLCFQLGSMPLQSPDEGRYSEAAREMLESGEWLIPQFGYVERVNKPPLFYWAAAASMRVFGVNETAARLPSLLAALAIALILYLLGRKAWGEDSGQAVALVLMTSLLFAALARTAITDMLLCFCLTATVAAFWWAVRDRSTPATLLFFVAAAAGTLTKGPVAVALPGLIGVLYLTLTRQWRQVRWGAIAVGIVLYAALAIPWYAAVQARHPGFLHYFFVGENLQRFAGNEHPEPLWFYLPILVVGFGVWIPSLLSSLGAAGRRLRELPQADPATLLALLWAGVIFAFFSLSKGKLPTYILPCFPPLALLVGRHWAQSTETALKPAGWTRLHLLLAAAGLVAVAVSLYLMLPRLLGLAGGASPGVGMLAAATIGLGGFIAGYAGIRGNPCARFGALAAAGALLTLGGANAAAMLVSKDDGAAVGIAQILSTQAPQDARLFLYKEDGLTALRFYVGKLLGSSRRLQDLPPLERPPIDGNAAAEPRGRRVGARRRRAGSGTGSPAAALSTALKQPGPVLLVTEAREYERIRPLLASMDAEQLSSTVGKYVVKGRLTEAPKPGKSPIGEPNAGPEGLKGR